MSRAKRQGDDAAASPTGRAMADLIMGQLCSTETELRHAIEVVSAKSLESKQNYKALVKEASDVFDRLIRLLTKRKNAVITKAHTLMGRLESQNRALVKAANKLSRLQNEMKEIQKSDDGDVSHIITSAQEHIQKCQELKLDPCEQAVGFRLQNDKYIPIIIKNIYELRFEKGPAVHIITKTASSLTIRITPESETEQAEPLLYVVDRNTEIQTSQTPEVTLRNLPAKSKHHIRACLQSRHGGRRGPWGPEVEVTLLSNEDAIVQAIQLYTAGDLSKAKQACDRNLLPESSDVAAVCYILSRFIFSLKPDLFPPAHDVFPLHALLNKAKACTPCHELLHRIALSMDTEAHQQHVQTASATKRRSLFGKLPFSKDTADTSTSCIGVVNLLLGFVYLNGIGIGKDAKKATTYFRLSADTSKNSFAQFYLGKCYAGEGVVDWRESRHHINLSVKQKNPLALTFQAVAHLNGTELVGKTQNLAEALRLLKEASDQGYACAQNYLGMFYKRNYNTVVDSTGTAHAQQLAVSLFTQAAKQGHDWAQYNLGEYRRTLGEDSEADRLTELALAQGFKPEDHPDPPVSKS
ncbi:hypothetical protein Pelo_6849 [Pelomyxa schiedti]|nr:hypothetical protein Pelo_6849 [Pelomyxa schiedti]